MLYDYIDEPSRVLIAPQTHALKPHDTLRIHTPAGLYIAQVADHEQRCWWSIPADVLVHLGRLSDVHVDVETAAYACPINAQALLAPWDVDTIEQARKRIASTARPIKDPWLLRLCCKRAIALFPNDFEILGLCLCPVAYRILDAQLEEDLDWSWFQTHAQRLYDWGAVVKPPAYARWTTSVLMAHAYLHLHHDQPELAEAVMLRLLEFAAMIPYAALIQTNLVRTSFLLAHHYLDIHERKLATLMLKRVIQYCQAGIAHSDFLGADNGYVKFSEVEVTLRGAKYAQRALSLLEAQAPVSEVKKAYNLLDLGGYTAILEKRKREHSRHLAQEGGAP
jgi:hypothetical protein